MRVLFVLHGPLDCQSGVQIFHYANGLADRGWDAAVCAPDDPNRVRIVGEPRFEPLHYKQVGHAVQRWGGPPDLIHAWTPREHVRRQTIRYAVNHEIPYLIHIEDDEVELLRAQLGVPPGRPPSDVPESRIAEDQFSPHTGDTFLRGAAGVTLITESLSQYARAARPSIELYPCLDGDRFSASARSETRARLGILDSEFIVVYPGNMHAGNRADVFSLYLAIAMLRQRGHPVRLVRLGEDYATGLDESWEHLKANVIMVGSTPWPDVPRYLAAADAFVQPGRLNAFNRNRLPAKIPEFLATGKPTLLPAANVGLKMEHGVNALLLQQGDATETADQLESLIRDPERAARIGAAGREFALRTFDPEPIIDSLEAFYNAILERWNESQVLRRLVALRGPSVITPPPDPVSPSRRVVRRVKRELARRL